MREGTRPYRRLGRCCSRPLGPAEATEPGGQPRLSAGGCRLGWPGTQRRRGKAPGGASDVGSARLLRGAPRRLFDKLLTADTTFAAPPGLSIRSMEEL